MHIERAELPEGIDSIYDWRRDVCVISTTFAFPAALLFQYAEVVRTTTLEVIRLTQTALGA